jgi:hypothetical protein
MVVQDAKCPGGPRLVNRDNVVDDPRIIFYREFLTSSAARSPSDYGLTPS